MDGWINAWMDGWGEKGNQNSSCRIFRKKNNKITCQTFGIWDEAVIYIILKDRTCLC